MALVTVRRIRAVYKMLCEFPPFNRWRLPDASVVKFQLIQSLLSEGEYNCDEGKHSIGVNPHLIHKTDYLLYVIAHEMAHMKQELNGRRPGSKDEQHNREFYRIKRLVCRDLGLDVERF